jgi:dCMP deaminase
MIIGITGTIGAGKGTIVEFLKKRGFKHYSARDFITEEIVRRGLPVNRDSMVVVANDLRARFGAGYVAESLYERAKSGGGDCVLESLRTVGEIESLRKKESFVLFAVDADPEIRYSRIAERKQNTDMVSFDEFLRQEEREMNSGDSNKQNLSACIERADYVFKNDWTISELYNKVSAVLDKLAGSCCCPVRENSDSVKKRMNWDDYFMKIASVVAERSTCLRHNIGAVIVRDKRILSTGYNGAVAGAKDCLELGCKKDEMNVGSGIGAMEVCRAVHAEQNAIIQAALHGTSTKGATLYCTTIPCRMCAKEIINAGIKKVLTYSDYAGSLGSIDFLKENGVEFEKINRPEDKIYFMD